MTVVLEYSSKERLRNDTGKRPKYSETNPDCPEFIHRGRLLAAARWSNDEYVTILMRYGRMVKVI